MKSVMRPLVWLITLLVLGMACYLGAVHAQAPERGEQLITPGDQPGERPGQGGMGERGQMT